MSENQTFYEKIRQLIATDDLNEAIRLLQELLKNSPKLNEVILQSARLSDVSRQIRLGLMDDKQASITKNKIRIGILELLNEIETQEVKLEIKKEVETAISILNSKNVVTGAIQAGGNVHLGDKTTITQNAEKIYNIGNIGEAEFNIGKAKGQKGAILHSIPKKMQINNIHRCIIRVAFDNETVLKNLPTYAKDVIIKEDVRVTENMEVVFEENEYFKIKPINTPKQLIDIYSATEWNFDITPLKLGKFPLTFKISIVLPNGLKEVILTESVTVTTEPVEAAMVFMISDLGPADEKHNIQFQHHGKGDIVGRDKIDRQINILSGNYIEGQTVYKSLEGSPPKPTKSILFAAANPSDLARIQTDVEYRTIKEEIQKGNCRDDFQFLPVQLAVRITELMRSFKDKPIIVHFSGHGDQNGILVSTDQNEALPLNDATIKRLFKPLIGATQLVLLNSCYSANQAEIISKLGTLVVGHNLPIGDAAAISFAKGFYLGLSEGMSYEDAYNDGITAVLAENPSYAHVIEVWKDGQKLEW